MTYTFKLSRRIARLRFGAAIVATLSFGACSGSDSLAPSTPSEPQFATTSWAGGIPMGIFSLPNDQFGSRYNGAVRIIWPEYLLNNLSAIKSRGGRVVLNLAGGQRNFTDANGHFSFTMWKARVDQFKTVNFGSYVTDGTIIGHFLLDEPNDPTNWNGVPVSPATIEAMAKYSKQIWPNMPTLVRTYPDYLSSYSGSYQYLDGAWAQYVYRKGDVSTFLASNVAQAKNEGLALIVGLNILKGGPDGAPMTASQVQSWGSTLLGSAYPCAFLSWEYDGSYLASTSMQSAMDVLRSKAQNRTAKACTGDAADGSITAPAPTPAPAPETTASPLPFGLYRAPLADYSTKWTGSVYNADPSDLIQRLARADSVGMKLIVRLARPAKTRNADGTFNLTAWKQEVDRFRGMSLSPYLSDGTLYLHFLVDQPSCAACWGGTPITWDALEEMARYSKSIWPLFPTTARVSPAKLAGASFSWTYLDAGWAQYSTNQGDLKTYLATQVAAAKSEGLGLIVGLNLLEGAGSGSAPMTASQITKFGTELAAEPSVCAMVGWKYDQTYLGTAGIQGALDSVTTLAKHRSPASCVVS